MQQNYKQHMNTIILGGNEQRPSTVASAAYNDDAHYVR